MSKILFEIEDAKIVNENPDSQFATAELTIFSSGPNRHNMVCSEETLKKTAPTCYEKPIIFEIRYGGDFGTHSDNTVPAGFIVKDSAKFERQEDGRLSLVVLGKIWKMYSGRFIDVFKKLKTSVAKLSVEMELFDSERVNENLVEMKDFVYSAACILGSSVTEASPGANIQMLSFEYNEAVKKEFSRYSNIDFTIPEIVKSAVKEGIELNKSYGKSSATCLAIGKFMAKNDSISPEKARNIFKYLEKSKSKPKNRTNPDGAYISYMLYGGDESYNWAKNLVEAMDKEDSENPVYFDVPASNKEEKEEFSMEEEKKVEEMATETPAEEKEEEKKEEGEGSSQESEKEETKETEKEGEKEEMSLDANLDVSACLAMLDSETEEYASLSADFACGKMNYAKLCNALYTQMCNMKASAEKMSAELENYSKENVSLREFKTSVDSKEFAVEVEKVLNEVSDVMPKDKLEEAREDSKNFSVENIDGWKNKTRAIAFSFVKTSKKEEGNLRIQMPYSQSGNATTSTWKR